MNHTGKQKTSSSSKKKPTVKRNGTASWDSGVLVENNWGIFDLVAFKFIGVIQCTSDFSQNTIFKREFFVDVPGDS